MIETLWIPDRIDYDGTQLRAHWAYHRCGLQGDCIVAFRGGCDVPTENLVDLEDRRAGARIFSTWMIHFLVEHFDRDLDRMILRQRLLVCLAAETLHALSGTRPTRSGDDLFVDGRKLSVSIATASPVSTLVHLGINEDATGAPVAACDLGDLGVDGEEFAVRVLASYREEMAGAARARSKVAGVD